MRKTDMSASPVRETPKLYLTHLIIFLAVSWRGVNQASAALCCDVVPTHNTWAGAVIEGMRVSAASKGRALERGQYLRIAAGSSDAQVSNVWCVTHYKITHPMMIKILAAADLQQ